MVDATERRAAPRLPHEWRVTVYHPQLGRNFRARTVNLSAGGALLRVPLSMPVAPQQRLELRLAAEQAEWFEALGSQPSLPHQGNVVRVDRGLLLAGETMVAIEFWRAA